MRKKEVRVVLAKHRHHGEAKQARSIWSSGERRHLVVIFGESVACQPKVRRGPNSDDRLLSRCRSLAAGGRRLFRFRRGATHAAGMDATLNGKCASGCLSSLWAGPAECWPRRERGTSARRAWRCPFVPLLSAVANRCSTESPQRRHLVVESRYIGASRRGRPLKCVCVTERERMRKECRLGKGRARRWTTRP